MRITLISCPAMDLDLCSIFAIDTYTTPKALQTLHSYYQN